MCRRICEQRRSVNPPRPLTRHLFRCGKLKLFDFFSFVLVIHLPCLEPLNGDDTWVADIYFDLRRCHFWCRLCSGNEMPTHRQTTRHFDPLINVIGGDMSWRVSELWLSHWNDGRLKNDNNNSNNKIIIIRYDRAVLPHSNGSCGYPARFLLNTWSLNEYWMNLLWADGESVGVSNACL